MASHNLRGHRLTFKTYYWKSIFFHSLFFKEEEKFDIFLHTITRSLMAFNWAKLTKGMPIYGVCVCVCVCVCAHITHFLCLHYMPFYRSACPSISLTLRKRNQILLEKGEARISRWWLDSYVLLLSTVTVPSAVHSIKSPSGSFSRESNRVDCGQKRCSKLC